MVWLQVYVMGCSVVVVHRPSLRVPPEDEDITAERKGIQIMTRVSAFDSKSPMGCDLVTGPPNWLLEQLAATLRSRLHLQLINFDLVRPTENNAPGICCLSSEGHHAGSSLPSLQANVFPNGAGFMADSLHKQHVFKCAWCGGRGSVCCTCCDILVQRV